MMMAIFVIVRYNVQGVPTSFGLEVLSENSNFEIFCQKIRQIGVKSAL